MPRALPPAGDPVVLRARPRCLAAEACWTPYEARYYDSGTSALGAALAAAVRLTGKPQPEVLLPAYGCPALIAATLWAGAQPVLVDLEHERPWLSLAAVEAALSSRTAAVVGVHLFGLEERAAALRERARRVGALLVEDSAQGFAPGSWHGDFVVLSFGRGKPVSLLGGGAALSADERLAAGLPPPQSGRGTGRFLPQALAYNQLRRPWLYWLPQRIPGLGLGATRFEPLRAVGDLDPRRRHLLPAAIAAYLAQPATAQRAIGGAVARLGGFQDLAQACDGGKRRLIRFPLLAVDRETRDQALAGLTRAGLGATWMYGSALMDVADVPESCRSVQAPAARDFASRLLTLPVHRDVGPEQVAAMAEILAGAVNPGTNTQLTRNET